MKTLSQRLEKLPNIARKAAFPAVSGLDSQCCEENACRIHYACIQYHARARMLSQGTGTPQPLPRKISGGSAHGK